MIPVIAGAAVQYAQSKEGKKMISTTQKSADSTTNIIMAGSKKVTIGLVIFSVVVTAVAAYFLLKPVIKKWQENRDELKRSKEHQAQIEKEVDTKKLSYPSSEYSSMADTIEDAVDGVGTNDAAIYKVFMRMNNDADLLQLQAAYGIRFGDEDLFASIRADMNEEEIARLNRILAQRNISIRVS